MRSSRLEARELLGNNRRQSQESGWSLGIADAHRDDGKRLRAIALTGWPDFCDPRRVANTMKMHVLLGLVLAGLLCSCAASSPHSGTTTGTQQTVHTQAPLTPQVGPNRR